MPPDPDVTAPLEPPLAYEPYLGPPAPPPGPRIWPWLLALLVLVLLGAGIGIGWALARNNSGRASPTTSPPTLVTGTVSVPNVVGQRADRAASALVDAGLKASLRSQSSNGPAGIVLAQRPAASASGPQGSTVLLTVSRAAVPPAATQVAVPDVVGRTWADATKALIAAGFLAGPRTVPSSRPAATVVAQSPAAGHLAGKGARVRINVAQGGGTTSTTSTTTTAAPTTAPPATVSIPDLTGSSLADAKSTLAGAGLKADVKAVPSTQPKNTVIAQYPAAGATARRGGSIRLNVSQGPGTKAVPDVVGDDQSSAETQIRNAGFDVNVVQQSTSDSTQDGVVLDETPAGGSQSKPGSTVTITVGVYATG